MNELGTVISIAGAGLAVLLMIELLRKPARLFLVDEAECERRMRGDE